MLKKIILNRLQLHNDIYNKLNKERDELFMQDYQILLPNSLLLNFNEAMNKLKFNNKIKLFIDELKNEDIDSLIGGSFGLWCTLKNSNFIPNDIDLYIKNLTKDHLLLIEKIITKLFNKNNFVVLVVRSPLTMTWHIQSKINNQDIFNIQIMILNITSWSEIFVTYHSDICCIGYDILKEKFLYLKTRWENILNNNTHIHYFSNILNLDSEYNLKKATLKYKARNFNCNYINVLNKDDEIFIKNNYGINVFNPKNNNYNNVNSKENCIYNSEILSLITKKYKYIDNINYSISVDYLFDKNEMIPPIMYLSIYCVRRILKKIQDNFIEYFTKSRQLFNDNDFYAAKLHCLQCDNIFVLKTFINNLPKCQHTFKCPHKVLELKFI